MSEEIKQVEETVEEATENVSRIDKMKAKLADKLQPKPKKSKEEKAASRKETAKKWGKRIGLLALGAASAVGGLALVGSKGDNGTEDDETEEIVEEETEIVE